MSEFRRAITVLTLAAVSALPCLPAQAAGSLTVENGLAACMTVQTGARTTAHGTTLLDVTLDIRKPIGECGCTSAIVAYAAYANAEGGARSLLLQGRIGARKSGPISLPLAADATLIGDRPATLSLGCAAPD
ncbi:DUF2195 family protein [Bordetella genomosp. 9]|uniref:DUF2195 family protein n=1 Tax=Bordetella genomosp. 9 TaxID=1416803 RepID=UPI001E63F076|nr:DUF2195 family protein [Bordetella genomosp. 9]